jgi:hypothetical protein
MGGGTKASGTFPGKDAVEKRKLEIVDAHKVANACLKGDGIKGGFFAITANAAGKLTAQQIKWDGPAPVAQCVLDAADKATITPLAGPPVGALWEFWAPGAEPPTQQLPADMEGKLAPVNQNLQDEVQSCEQRFLGQEFYAEVKFTVFLTADGKAYAPTLTDSNSHDSAFDGCVLDAVAKAKFPTLDIINPIAIPLAFKVGSSGKT